MIVRMALVSIIGPKTLQRKVLAVVRQLGMVQVETDRTVAGAAPELPVRAAEPDARSLAERSYYEELLDKVDELIDCLPAIDTEESLLDPAAAVDLLAALIDEHRAACGQRRRRGDELRQALAQHQRTAEFLCAVEPLRQMVRKSEDLELVAVSIRDQELIDRLHDLIDRLTEGHFDLQTAPRSDGTAVGIIATRRPLAERLRELLAAEEIPEEQLPDELATRSFAEQIRKLQAESETIEAELEALDQAQLLFARRWLPAYRLLRDWFAEQLSLLRSAAQLYETALCFVLFGWVAAADLERLRAALAERFGEQVVIEEKEVREENVEQVPVALRNPPYFKPFELLVRLLPIPRYRSFDPTPFIGIFFPIFFGLILGDIGYGLVCGALGLLLIRLGRKRPALGDAGRILGFGAFYAVLFGIFFGEFFGELGGHALGIKPILFDRRTAIMPMLSFALALGVIHVILGLFLGMLTALRFRKRKEALFKLFSILMVFGLVLLFAAHLLPGGLALRRPLLAAIGVIVVIALLSGGVLAPLELFKTIGHIVSYVRIMAVGLTSVLLAYVANSLAGEAGSIWLGIMIGVLLHAFNILLGIFAPTIHSLRLHYVEFFSKFVEHGGRRFTPFDRNHSA